jgi:anti-anti-sigma regulatory factor
MTTSLGPSPLPATATLVATGIELSRGVLVLLEGEAGAVGLDPLQLAFARVAARRPALALLDFSRLTLLSSLAMGQLVTLRRALRRWNGGVRLVGCPPAIREALAAAGVSDFFGFYVSVKEAILAG